MSNKGKYVGAGIAVVAVIVVLLYTNVYDLAKPAVEQGVESAKDVVSKVDGEDVVSGAETVSSAIKNETDKIEVKNPFE